MRYFREMREKLVEQVVLVQLVPQVPAAPHEELAVLVLQVTRIVPSKRV
jgi:hypothetical protein